MKLPKPKLGLVINYAFLWNYEYKSGQEEGRKDRPCAIIAAIHEDDDPDLLVVSVLPITHVEPQDLSIAIEIPLQTKLRLGLDHARSWIICNELNEFEWPGVDIRPIAGREEQQNAYGYLPPKLFSQVQQKIFAIMQQHRLMNIKRTN